MSTQVQYRRGSNVQVAAFTGALGELVVDTTNHVVVVNDGSTVGGFPLVGTSATQTLTNKTLSSFSVTGSISGNLVPATNNTYTLGNATNSWQSIYVAGNTIYLGSIQLKSSGNTFSVYSSDGVTLANIGAAGLSVTSITNGTSAYQFAGVNGNAVVTAGGANSLVVTSTGANVTGYLTTSANITGGNILTAGTVSATGNISGSYVLGNGALLTGLTPSKIFNGTSEANIGASGGNANISIGGTSNVLVVASTGQYITGVSSASGNITGGNLLTGGQVSATANVQANNLTATNWVTAANVSASGNVLVSGYMSVVGNLYVANIVSSQTLTVDDPLLYLTANTPYPYNYSIGFYSAFTGGAGNTYQHTGLVRDYTDGIWKLISNVPEPSGSSVNFTNAIYDPLKTGAITATSGAFSSTLSATGNITGGNILGGANVNATTHTGTTVSVSANITGGNILTGGLISATGAVTGSQFNGSGAGLTSIPGANVTGTLSIPTTSYAATVSTAAQPNITSVGTLTSITTSGALTVNSGAAATAIVNGASNGVGNIGSSTTYFNTVFAKATSAQYADLAEMYCADSEYTPGTVVEFGGEQEITISTESHSTRVAGIISTNPSYLMNSALDCTNALEVALVGRVPCRVVGTIRKGDRLVASGIPGVATALDPEKYQPGCIIGKALEAYDSIDDGVIEVAVGRT